MVVQAMTLPSQFFNSAQHAISVGAFLTLMCTPMSPLHHTIGSDSECEIPDPSGSSVRLSLPCLQNVL